MNIKAKMQDILLVEKFGQYFIRYYIGSFFEIPIEYEVDKNTYNEIVSNPNHLEEIHKSLIKDVNVEEAINFTIINYVKNKYPNSPEQEITDKLNIILKYDDIYNEFYDSIIYLKTFEQGAISEQNISVHKLVNNYKFTLIDAYVYLVYLREHPLEALKDLGKYSMEE